MVTSTTCQKIKEELEQSYSNKAGISQGTYERGRNIIQNGSEEQKKKLRKGKSTINKECNKIKKDQKREELKSIKTNIELPPENCKLFCNDFTKIDSETIPDNSIDLIFTDPPYGEQYLYLYEDLARLAVRVLKPGGSLVFYAGHIILNKVFNISYRYKSSRSKILVDNCS